MMTQSWSRNIAYLLPLTKVFYLYKKEPPNPVETIAKQIKIDQ
jgi:hypothetical protein